MYNFKRLEDLTFTDDFMFSQVMKNKEICKEVVETILGIKIGRIEFLTSQYEIEIATRKPKLLLWMFTYVMRRKSSM